MRILIVSWYFPPSNTMGALRVGKLAKFLHSRGHDVAVVTARDVPRPQNLVQEFPEDRIERVAWLDVNRWPRSLAAARRRIFGAKRPPSDRAPGKEPAPDPYLHRRWSLKTFAACLGSLYMDLVNLPDASIGWVPYALRAGRRLVERGRPDVIFASGPPFSALIVGHLLGRRFAVPWIAELRDRWSDDPYYPPVAWRARILRALEARLLRRAAGLVTVSEPWATAYRDRYGRPTVAIYNGYDPDDVRGAGAGTPGPGPLKIVHAGRIYPGRRDPTPLFEALGGVAERDHVRISFVGTTESVVMPLAEVYGVGHLVEVQPQVPYREALAAQRAADVLLLMQWNDPKEVGNVPGKVFEYLAMRRPILGLGPLDGVPATMIRARQAGLFSNEPREIARQVSAWLAEKRATGRVAALPESVNRGVSRIEQFAKLEAFLGGIVAGQRP